MSAPATLPVVASVTNPIARWSVAVVFAVFAGILLFELMDISVFTRIGMPHEFCYLRDGKLVWLHVISDALIGIAYVSISATLAYLVHRASRGIPFDRVFLAFGLFIVSCGMTHFMEVWVIWEPVYWMSGFVKVVTAAASVATAITLVPLLPRIFALIDSARRSDQRRIEIEQLNTELERSNQALKGAEAGLLEADKRKNYFLALLGHELRNPLAAIRGGVALLRSEKSRAESRDAAVAAVGSQVAHMERLVDDLLEVTRIVEGMVQVRKSPMVLQDAVNEAIVMLRARTPEIDVIADLDSEPLELSGDRVRLVQVFANLLENAFKYSGAARRVELNARRENAEAIVRVRDYGLGIPPEILPKIFEPFVQAAPGLTLQSGLGLGLAVVRHLVRSHGGEVTATTFGAGQGSQFEVRLPCSPVKQ